MTPEEKLSAKRWNEFRGRAANACLTVGTAITTGAVVSLLGKAPEPDAPVWCGVGVVLIGISMILPYFIESEE